MINKVKEMVLRFWPISTLLSSGVGFYFVASGVSHELRCRSCEPTWTFSPDVLAVGIMLLLAARLIYINRPEAS